ncbi:MAG: flagellar hook-basal body protein [Gemmatimonadaceae bacterium]
MGTSVRPNGMSSAAAALRYWERRQEVSSNNLANVSTDGFKGQKVFAQMVEGALPAANAVTDFTPGPLNTTGNPLDVAIEGRGFLVVNTPNGERLSRGGSLHVDDAGTLTDSAGNALMGESGPVRISTRGNSTPGEIQISRSGAVTVDKAEVGRLRLETVPDNTPLAREGSGLFIPLSKRAKMDGETNSIRQGSLEQSNVSSVSEMVDMISIQRAYTAVQKAMTTLDGARGIATTELGRPAN